MKRRDVLLASLGILVIWQLAAMLVNRSILPSPVVVLQVFFRELGGDLPVHFAASLWRVVAGMLVSVLTAVPAGLAIGGSKRLNRIFSPVIYLLYPIPKVVFVPVVLLFLGIGDLAKIVVIFLILFFQIVVLVRDQAAGLPPQLLQSLRSLGAGRGLVPFRLPTGQPARHPDRATSVGGHGGGSAVYRRIVCYTQGTWLLHILQRQHAAGLSRHVRGRAGDVAFRIGIVFYSGLDGKKAVPVEVCQLKLPPSK
jgi:hypothetical protein